MNNTRNSTIIMNILATLFSLLTVVNCQSWYDCVPGITGSIGVSTPRGDISLNVGSKPIELFCHLNPNNTHYSQQGYTAASLSMEMTGRSENHKRIDVPAEMNSTWVNSTTIRTVFDPSLVGHFDIRCRLAIKEKDRSWEDESESSWEGEELVNVGVCLQRIHVGYPPLAVENFKCISENWSNLNCTWDEPYNPVKTEYSLHYAEPGGRFRVKQCPTRNNIEEILGRKVSRDVLQCYIDERTLPSYRKPAHSYTFIFNATNPLKTDGLVTVHRVDHYAIVRAGPAESVVLTTSGDSSLSLTYSTPLELNTFPAGLNHEIRVSEEYEEKVWVETAQWDQESGQYLVEGEERFHPTWDGSSHTMTVLLDQLDFAWSLYTVRVRLISATADKTDPSLWSRPVTVSQRTAARAPDLPPPTCRGSFQAVDNLSSRTVFVYWEQVERKFHNGPGFHYIVTLLSDSDTEPPVTVNSTHSFAKFEGLPLETQLTFSVRSVNTAGSSSNTSLVSVPPQSTVTGAAPQSVTTIYSSQQESYRVSWYPPGSPSRPVSYTVFWCRTNSSLPHYCSGRLQWTRAESLTSVTGLDTSLATLVYSLNLDPDKEYRLAVAADTELGSSGLVWSSCVVINNRMTSTVRNLAEDARGETWVSVRWSLPCSERGGAVLGYNVTWCRTRADCTSRTVETTGLNMTGLLPWTEYSVSLTVLTTGLTLPGGTSLPVTVRTRSGRPASPPTRLSLGEVTNTTAYLAWDKPSLPNGPITSYRVFYQSEGSSPLSLSTSSPSVSLTSLAPFTSYQVTVLACNLAQSGAELCADSKDLSSLAVIKLRTAVGRPEMPPSPQVSFINSSMATIKWNSDFPLGAAEASYWNVSIEMVEEENLTATGPREVMFRKVVGTSDQLAVDLTSLDPSQDWSCQNNTVLHAFNISISASVTSQENIVFTGPWSREVSVRPPCSIPTPYLLIVGIVIPVVLVVIIIVLVLLKTLKWAKRKKEFFTKLGQELDDKYVTVTKVESRQEYERQTQDYQTTNFGGRTENGKNYFPNEDKDFMETLLEQRANGREADKSSLRDSSGETQPRVEMPDSPGDVPQSGDTKQQEQHQPVQADPARGPGGYIQLSLVNAPVTKGYIQIQQLENSVPLPVSKTEIALLDSVEGCPGYSKLGAVPNGGYIQFPGSPVLISPSLLDNTDLVLPVDLPRNTVV